MDNNNNSQSDGFSTGLPNLNEITENLLSTFRSELSSGLRALQQHSSSTRHVQQQIASPALSTHTNPCNTTTQEIRRIFPTISRTVDRVGVPNVNKKRKRPVVTAKFTSDVILLKNPNINQTLRGKIKTQNYKEGFAVSAVTFSKSWSQREITEFIKELFRSKLGDTEFELLVPMSGELVIPNLVTGTELNGEIVKKIYFQKDIYVRPLSSLVSDSHEHNVCLQNLHALGEEESVDASESHLHVTGDVNTDDLRDVGGEESFDASESHLHVTEEIGTMEALTEFKDYKFEEDTLLAINNSLEDTLESFNGTLMEFSNKIDSDKTSYFNIYRPDIFHCCIRAINRKSFNPLSKISVKFSDQEGTSEGAVDIGGPTREMFRLVLRYIQTSALFDGPANSKNIRLDYQSFHKEYYYEAGRLMALSIIHVGRGPNFFSESLYSYLIFGLNYTKPSVDDIYDQVIKKEVIDLSTCTNSTEFQQIIMNSDFLSYAGFSSTNNLENKETTIESAIKYFVIHRVRPALEQLEKGLNYLNVLDKLRKFPVDTRNLFCMTTEHELTVLTLRNLFKVNYSEQGSNNRNLENQAIVFFWDFVEECADNETEVTLSDILSFTTGSDNIPVLGFDQSPEINFLHHEESKFPKANTCALILSIPVVHKIYETFKENMVFAIKNGMAFGFA